MSEYVRTKAVLTEVKTNDIEETCKQILQNEFHQDITNIPLFINSYTEWLTDCYYKFYVVLNNRLYKISDFEEELDPTPEYCNIQICPDGKITFDTMYYNGCANWREIVQDELKCAVKDC